MPSLLHKISNVRSVIKQHIPSLLVFLSGSSALWRYQGEACPSLRILEEAVLFWFPVAVIKITLTKAPSLEVRGYSPLWQRSHRTTEPRQMVTLCPQLGEKNNERKF